MRPSLQLYLYRMDLQDVWSSVEHLTSVGGGGMKVHKRESSVFDLVAEYSCHHRPSNLSQRILPKVRQFDWPFLRDANGESLCERVS